MFKTVFAGTVDTLGAGVYTSNWMARRSLLEIGGKRIRRVMLSDFMDTMLETAAENGQPVKVFLGWTLLSRWVLALHDGRETHREGIFLFLAGMLTQLVSAGFAAILVAWILSTFLPESLMALSLLLMALYILATLVLNVKAWLGLSKPNAV